jgi:hypothetical protein
LLLAVVADSDPGAVYEQHRWLGAVVAASASCAYVAMMGWATLRHGGLPAPVLLMALALASVPFLLGGVPVLPAAAVAVAGCAALATYGLRHPPASTDGTRFGATALAGVAVMLAAGQAIAVDLVAAPPRADVLQSGPTTPKSPARPGGTDAARAPAAAKKRAKKPAPATSPGTAAEGPVVAEAPAPPDLSAAARDFVRNYYAALDAHDYPAAWDMLSPDVRRAFGGFAAWKQGYAHTPAHNLGRLRIVVAGGAATVGVTLRAGNRGACDTVVARRFAVTWRLVRTEAGLRAAAAKGRRISGTEPC